VETSTSLHGCQASWSGLRKSLLPTLAGCGDELETKPYSSKWHYASGVVCATGKNLQMNASADTSSLQLGTLAN